MRLLRRRGFANRLHLVRNKERVHHMQLRAFWARRIGQACSVVSRGNTALGSHGSVHQCSWRPEVLAASVSDQDPWSLLRLFLTAVKALRELTPLAEVWASSRQGWYRVQQTTEERDSKEVGENMRPRVIYDLTLS